MIAIFIVLDFDMNCWFSYKSICLDTNITIGGLVAILIAIGGLAAILLFCRFR